MCDIDVAVFQLPFVACHQGGEGRGAASVFPLAWQSSWVQVMMAPRAGPLDESRLSQPGKQAAATSFIASGVGSRLRAAARV